MNEEEKREVVQYALEMTEDRLPTLVKEQIYKPETDIFMSPESISTFCKKELHLDRRCEEHIYLVGLDVKGHILGVFEVGHGTISLAPCGIQGVVCRLLLSNSPNAVLIHNHPSGEVLPSMEDQRLAERVGEATEMFGIQLLDFLIVGANDAYFSFNERGLLRNGK